MLNNILVYGWYYQGNIGDDLFIDAFKKIFPQLNFTFTDQITLEKLQSNDAIFIGGGSFLEFPLKIKGDILNQIKQKPIFYIGIGAETNIHHDQLELMKLAKLISIRSYINLDKILSINKNTIVIPDLVRSLSDELVISNKKPNSVLIIPNLSLVPQNIDAYWKHISWNYFKSEFSQFLDILIEKNYSINFLPMCNNREFSDSWAAYEIISHMNHRQSNLVLPPVDGLKDLSKIISSYEAVITQRFHGIILSEMLNVPYLAIYHHDKLKPTLEQSGEFISFYSLNKNLLLNKIKNTFNHNFAASLPIERNIFSTLNQMVLDILSSE